MILGLSWGTWAAIAAGSAVGGVWRQVVTDIVTRATGPGFPWGTLVVNVVGSVVMGGVAAASAASAGGWSPTARHLLMTGLLGGFTTFSSFSMQTVALVQDGRLAYAAGNVGLSVVLCVASCWAGYVGTNAVLR